MKKKKNGRPCVDKASPSAAMRARMRTLNGQKQKKCGTCEAWLAEEKFGAHRIVSAGGAVYYRPHGWCIDCDKLKRETRAPRFPSAQQLKDAEPIFRASIVPGENGCLNFKGSILSTGYGYLNIANRIRLAHHLSLFYFKGIPLGHYNKTSRVVDHLCMNPACINPEHLEIVTGVENFRRARLAKLNNNRLHNLHLKRIGSAHDR